MKESDIQTHIVAWLSSVSRRYGFLFFSVPNEALLSICKGLGIVDRMTFALIAILKKMGLTPGASDLIIGHAGRMYAMEIKTATGSQSENQRLFEAWCTECGIPYRIGRSLAEAQEIMREWGIVE